MTTLPYSKKEFKVSKQHYGSEFHVIQINVDKPNVMIAVFKNEKVYHYNAEKEANRLCDSLNKASDW